MCVRGYFDSTYGSAAWTPGEPVCVACASGANGTVAVAGCGLGAAFGMATQSA